MTKHRMHMAALVSAALFASAGCSGSSTLALQLTDAPPDLAAMSAALVTLDDIDVHLAGAGEDDTKSDDKHDDGWVTLARTPETYDLLRLQDDVVAALGEFELPEGKITQIRLHIDPAGKNEIQLTNGQVCPLDLANVSTEGVKINHPFKALDLKHGHRTWVVVDFDLKESVSQEGACTFRLNPVIKLKSSKME